MDRRTIGLTFILALLLIVSYSPVMAQQGPMDDEDRPPRMDNDRPPRMDEGQMRGPQGMQGKRGRPGNFQNNPEMQKMREQQNAVRAIAEAHKELAKIYEAQNKIDESAAELKKILELFQSLGEKLKEEKKNDRGRGMGNPMVKKTIPIYNEIARLYLKNNRVDDAEKIMLEGIAKFENDDPHSASKLILELGEIYRKNGKLDKAEQVLKKVIELNQKALSK